MTADQLQALAEAAAAQPQTVAIDGTTVSQHSPKELADLADRKAAQTGASKNHRGIRFTKFNPPGAF